MSPSGKAITLPFAPAMASAASRGPGVQPVARGADTTGAMGLGATFDEVLAAAATGAEWALTRLYRQFQPALVSYLRFRDRDEAEDLAQEVWQGIGRGLAQFEGDEAAFRAWLFTIARRRVADLHRRRARRPADPVPEEHFAGLAGADDPEASAVANLGADEAVARITAALPPAQAEIVILRVVAGLDVAQVAALVGKRPGTVRVMQHRALRRLAAVFSTEGVTP
jgi:RNA polymerase sigma-70 factor, ECF subfamily